MNAKITVFSNTLITNSLGLGIGIFEVSLYPTQDTIPKLLRDLDTIRHGRIGKVRVAVSTNDIQDDILMAIYGGDFAPHDHVYDTDIQVPYPILAQHEQAIALQAHNKIIDEIIIAYERLTANESAYLGDK
jgi:hypothetical protein